MQARLFLHSPEQATAADRDALDIRREYLYSFRLCHSSISLDYVVKSLRIITVFFQEGGFSCACRRFEILCVNLFQVCRWQAFAATTPNQPRSPADHLLAELLASIDWPAAAAMARGKTFGSK